MSLDTFSLSGRVALVTGANTGLGQAIAIALAEAGADVIAAGRSDPTETGAAVKSAGRRFHAAMIDLSQRGEIGALIEECQSTLGAPDILVNNAGIIRRADALDVSEAEWDEVLNVNVTVPFLLSQAAARAMLAAGKGGKIINIASMLSFQGGVRVPAYTVAKSGVAGMTRALANEWAEKNINVNAIAPGYFVTNNTEGLRNDPDRSRDILARIPAGRWGAPADIGGAAVFLASGAADYMHGAIIPIDGGWLAR